MAHFLTFGSKSYTNTLLRIKVQACHLPFRTITCYTEDDLKSIHEFWNVHKGFIESRPRGYGYWIWKSFLTWKTLREMNEGDVLIYADAGCTLHHDPEAFQRIIDDVRNSNGVSACTLEYVEHSYCKMDLAFSLNALDHLSTNQLHATFFALKCTPENILLTKKWYDTMCDYHLIDDSPSYQPNTEQFIEHRHDQSVFSLLRKMKGVDVPLLNYPIEDTRIRH